MVTVSLHTSKLSFLYGKGIEADFFSDDKYASCSLDLTQSSLYPRAGRFYAVHGDCVVQRTLTLKSSQKGPIYSPLFSLACYCPHPQESHT